MPISTVRYAFLVAFSSALPALMLGGCGGGDTSTVDGANGSGANGTGATGNGPDLSGSGNGPGGPGGPVTMISPDAACATGSGAADAIPAVVEMVIDISGSMNWAPGTMEAPGRNGQSKWDITSKALKDAVAKLPSSIAVGINFFPGRTGNGECSATRPSLPIALLGAANSAQRRAFNAAIDNANPNGGTPTHAAFNLGQETVAASNLNGKKFVLLITDGIPTYTLECDGDGMTPVDNGPLITAVGAAYTGMPQVSTFVIGSPGSEPAKADLSKMASSGGTAKMPCSDSGDPAYCHLDMTTATDFGAALSSGLADVAGQIGNCDFTIPAAPAGQTLDPKAINVLYTHGDGMQSSIPQDQTGTCMSGWKYDNDVTPTKITLCGTDCDTVKGDQGSKVDVLFGCVTQTNVPVK